jgi:hypothetical protein
MHMLWAGDTLIDAAMPIGEETRVWLPTRTET